MEFDICNGDCIEVMRSMPDDSVDSIVTDPPYELGFMGKSWDSTGIAFNVEVWREALRVLKPGGHLLAFSGSRTYHRMAVAIEDAGFEIRDQIMWIYGSGFPKSLNVGKAIESTKLYGSSHSTALRKTEQEGDGQPYLLSGRNNGILGEPRVYDRKTFSPATAEAAKWEGWGTALKPAHEPIVMARKPFKGTVANNVLAHGTGGLNIDGSRVGTTDRFGGGAKGSSGFAVGYNSDGWVAGSDQGRWPANVIHDGSDEVLELFGDPARFFYCPKASKKDRNEGLEGFEEVVASEMVERKPDSAGMNSPRAGAGRTSGAQNFHPTVKPTDLMRYLVTLVTPPDGTVLDPFMGSGSTGKACAIAGFNFVGIELSADYLAIAEARIQHQIDQNNTRLM